MNIYKRVAKQVIAEPSAQSNDFVSLFSGLMQHNRKTIGANGGGNRLRGPLMKPIFLDWLCLIFGQKILPWWRRAIAANRRCLRKTETRRKEREGAVCVEPGRDASHPERDMTPCQMNRDIKSWCQEAEERDRFWPCVSVFASLSCAVTVCAARACACVESSLVCVVCDRDG